MNIDRLLPGRLRRPPRRQAERRSCSGRRSTGYHPHLPGSRKAGTADRQDARPYSPVPGNTACRCDTGARGFYDLGPYHRIKIIRKPRASWSRIRRLCCSAWRACRSPMRTLARTARWRYGRSPITRPRRRARTAGPSRPAGTTRCWPGRGMSSGLVTRWRCGGSSPGGNAMSRAAIARRSPSGGRRCRRGAG